MDGSRLSEATETQETLRQRSVYETAMKSIELEERRRRAAGYAVMSAASAFGEATSEGRFLGRVVHFAQLGCILFAFATPVYLFWSVALNG